MECAICGSQFCLSADALADGRDGVKRALLMLAERGLARTASGTTPTCAHIEGAGPSRFFYTAKAGPKERSAGLFGMPEVPAGARAGGRQEGSAGLVMLDGKANPYAGTSTPNRNPHPTVKPVNLMRWLIRMVTPSGAVCLDPFMGSGTTGIACHEEGCWFIGVEINPEYFEIAKARIEHAQAQGNLFP